MGMRLVVASLAAMATCSAAAQAQGSAAWREAARRAAVIDMHLHAYPADAQGPPPVTVCAPYDVMPTRDAAQPGPAWAAAVFGNPQCRHRLRSATSDTDLRDASIVALRRLDAVAMASGPAAFVDSWTGAAPERLLPGIEFGVTDAPSPAMLRARAKAGKLAVLGEIVAQYEGAGPDDPRLEPYWALAEELDLPVGIHMGPGPPGAPYFAAPAYRMALTDPLALEPVLVRHPRLRVYVMHAGWPMAERMIALLYAHPQVYVDTGVIDFTQPRAEFYGYLRRLVDAGYGKRILFGSDQMVWPDAIAVGVDAIRTAPFLSAAQKRDILHDNAARFLRLDER